MAKQSAGADPIAKIIGLLIRRSQVRTLVGEARPAGYGQEQPLELLLQIRTRPLPGRYRPFTSFGFEALKCAVHLVGDLHEPLHAADNGDKGGTALKVRFADETNLSLHALWDSAVFKRMLEEEGGIVDGTARPNDDSGSIKEWIAESHELGKNVVYPRLPGFSCQDRLVGPLRIDDSYYTDEKPVIKAQFRKAGVRLAKVLNEALAK